MDRGSDREGEGWKRGSDREGEGWKEVVTRRTMDGDRKLTQNDIKKSSHQKQQKVKVKTEREDGRLTNREKLRER